MKCPCAELLCRSYANIYSTVSPKCSINADGCHVTYIPQAPGSSVAVGASNCLDMFELCAKIPTCNSFIYFIHAERKVLKRECFIMFSCFRESSSAKRIVLPQYVP